MATGRLRLGDRGRLRLQLPCQDPRGLALAGPAAGRARLARRAPGATRVDHGGAAGAAEAVGVDP